jgi:hypothetical protein
LQKVSGRLAALGANRPLGQRSLVDSMCVGQTESRGCSMKKTIETIVILFLFGLSVAIAIWFWSAMSDEVQAIADIPFGAAAIGVISLVLAIAMTWSKLRRDR